MLQATFTLFLNKFTYKAENKVEVSNLKDIDDKATGSQFVTTQHDANKVKEKQVFIDPEMGPEKKNKKKK